MACLQLHKHPFKTPVHRWRRRGVSRGIAGRPKNIPLFRRRVQIQQQPTRAPSNGRCKAVQSQITPGFLLASLSYRHGPVLSSLIVPLVSNNRQGRAAPEFDTEALVLHPPACHWPLDKATEPTDARAR